MDLPRDLHVVPDLPCGVVTLIVLLGDDAEQSHQATVGDLLVSMLEQNLPVTYAAVDYAPGHLADNAANHFDGVDDALASVVIDQDYTVTSRLDDGNGDTYPHDIPTLDAVGFHLAKAGANSDRRLVILDGFERARPYRADGPCLIPSRVPHDAEDVDAWRTADLRAFARSRPNAPTVVIWHGNGVQRPEAKRSIGDAAEVLVVCNASLGVMYADTRE